jgi:hypothetical protein
LLSSKRLAGSTRDVISNIRFAFLARFSLPAGRAISCRGTGRLVIDGGTWANQINSLWRFPKLYVEGSIPFARSNFLRKGAAFWRTAA